MNIPNDNNADDGEARTPTMLEQMGGMSGLVSSVIPIIVFVVVNSVTSLTPAIWSAMGAAVAIAVWRIVRKETLQPAVSGVLGVALCAFIAYRTGEARGFFLFGIWASLVYGGAFLISLLVRWPLVGVVWSALNGSGFAWRKVPRARVPYDIATVVWTVFFIARYVVQSQLYDADETGWLGIARIAMGTPLTAVAVLVTIWAVRRSGRILEEIEAQQQPTNATEPATTGETGRLDDSEK
ncbi:intracellular septation protein A [Actinoalloteichus hymeniacidonis]|nr:intracellular septation protein A [Actinoalloteichus hymeniacidonis]